MPMRPPKALSKTIAASLQRFTQNALCKALTYLWGEGIIVLSEMATVYDNEAGVIVRSEVKNLMTVRRLEYDHILQQ